MSTTNTTVPINTNSLTNVFSQTSVIFLFWFLAIYFIVYFILGIFLNKNNGENGSLRIVRILDGIVFLFVLLFILSGITSTKPEDVGPGISKSLTKFKEFGQNPYSIFSVILFLVMFYAIIYMVRLPMTKEAKPISIMFIETIAILLFIILLIFDFFKYILKVDLLALLMNSLIDWFNEPLPTETTKPAATAAATTTPAPGNEVFNIRNNLYTYDEAKSVCSIYGAKLANYDQIEDSYDNGGEWCNYGWSEGQMALFPTQKDTWNKLQKTDNHKNNCGRPGINGGFIANPNIKYGANCYGKKPVAYTADVNRMNAQKNTVYPKSKKDVASDMKTEYWKKNSDKLAVNGFNNDKWSEF
jgi:hypothetical protein